MASPAVIGTIIKLLTDKDVWKGIGVLIATLCVPLILIIVAFLSIQSGFAKHNNEAIDTIFNDKSVSLLAPREYKEHIKDMKKAFKKIDEEVEKNEEDDGLDSTRIKAVFYALFFKEEVLFETEITEDDEEREVSKVDFEKFVSCFVSAERLPEVYRRIQNDFDIEITPEDKANATEIYYRILYGQSVPDYGESFDIWLASITNEAIDYMAEGEFQSPIDGWKDIVTSEYGKRIDPITKKESVHTGIDFGAVAGTNIYASKSGIVKFVRYKTTGYGYHTAIEHGDGEVTLYAHCSKILVTEGEEVEQGQVIAEVGSTGKSTGNHLHFEIRIAGETKNPRLYLLR